MANVLQKNKKIISQLQKQQTLIKIKKSHLLYPQNQPSKALHIREQNQKNPH
jgi:hypothetical protein